jgi:N-acetylglucosaminyldiphosphoundecaprenol N-acetyl-beta-D-mannosaminyltransferase
MAERTTVDILGIPIDKVDMTQALAITGAWLTETREEGSPLHAVYTPNSEIVLLGYKDHEFGKILAAADLCIPDGIGVVLASRIFGDRLAEKVAGAVLTQKILACSYPNPLRVFLFGGKPGVADEAAEKIKAANSDIMIVGTRDGFYRADEEESIVENIASTHPDLVLVALGMQKQESFIDRNRTKLNARVAIGVGGTIDILAGRAKPAPEFFLKHHLEWFYRLLKQPSRFVRMLALPKFLLIVIAVKLKIKKLKK